MLTKLRHLPDQSSVLATIEVRILAPTLAIAAALGSTVEANSDFTILTTKAASQSQAVVDTIAVVANIAAARKPHFTRLAVCEAQGASIPKLQARTLRLENGKNQYRPKYTINFDVSLIDRKNPCRYTAPYILFSLVLIY